MSEADRLRRYQEMEVYLDQERERRERLPVVESTACPQRVGFRFFPAETERLTFVASLVCEEREFIFLRSVGERCWGCPSCGLRVDFPEARILAGAGARAMRVFQGSMGRTWTWPWRRWFRGKKEIVSSET